MLNLSAGLDSLRSALLATFPEELSAWPVLHTVSIGETKDCNYRGIGPWARIWALPKRYGVIVPSKELIPEHKMVSYVVTIYFPRVVTTDSLLETLIHEYLHVGKCEGELNYHPPRQETEFIQRSKEMAMKFVSSNHLSDEIMRLLDDWPTLKRMKPTGITVVGLGENSAFEFTDPIFTDKVDLGALN